MKLKYEQPNIEKLLLIFNDVLLVSENTLNNLDNDLDSKRYGDL